MKHLTIPVTLFQQNCSLVWCEASGQAALIDPGGEAGRLLEAVAQHGLQLEQVLLTHGHLDHAGAAGELAQRLGIPILGPHRDDAFWLETLAEQCAMFGFPPVPNFTPDRWLNDGDSVNIGSEILHVIHAPGHTPGHVVFFHAAGRLAFVGDVIFQNSIGRSDFPRGDHEALIRSIRERLFPLGDDVSFVPGHGPNSTFGRERRHNPFVGEGV